jgi:beta-lactamase class C
MAINNVKFIKFLIPIVFGIVLVISFTRISQSEKTQNEPTAPKITFVDSTATVKIMKGYRAFVQNELKQHDIVGAAYTIVDKNKVLCYGTWGVKKQGTRDSINEHTVFRLASVSKGFAGTLACMLHQDSILDLQKPVREYIPGFRLKDSTSTFQLNLGHTLNHTSGLVPHAFDNLVEDNQDIELIVKRLDEVDIADKPGKIYGYQNVSFSLIDPIIKSLTGHDYRYMLKHKVLKPLEMEDASIGVAIFRQKHGNVAFPHRTIGSGEYRLLPPSETYYNVAPAAGVNASIDDMGKWLLALLGNYPSVIDSSVLRMISTPSVQTPLRFSYYKHWKTEPEKFYSLGWRIFRYQGRDIIYHGGYIKGYRAEVAFCPVEKAGIAYLQNCDANVASKIVPAFFEHLVQEVGAVKP